MKEALNFLATAQNSISEFFKNKKLKNISFKLTVRAYDTENKRPVEIVLKDFSKHLGINE